VSSRTPGRHRAPAAPRSTAATFGQLAGAVGDTVGGKAGAAAKTGAVLAVSGGLVASLGLQANATPHTPTAVTAAAPAAGVRAAAMPAVAVPASGASSAVPAALGHGVVAAPRYGEIGFTAKATPKPKPKSKPASDSTSTPKAGPGTAAAGRTATDRSDARGSAGRGERAARAGAHRAESRRSTRVSRSTERSSRSERRSSARAGAPGSASFGASVMRIAARYAGIMYRYGGTTPAGFDCSGYTSYVMRQLGISLPRTSGAQRAAARRVSRSEALPGDLVFMPGHVGIYAGNGQMWDSPRTGKPVSKRKIWSSSATFGRVG